MRRDKVLKAFDAVRVWERGTQRAPHKPLLILLELARISNGENPRVELSEIEEKLRRLIEEFGPSVASSPHMPFWHLATDGLWILEGPPELINRPPTPRPTITELRTNHVSGAFPPEIEIALKSIQGLIAEVARRLLDAHFPESIHNDILGAVGLSLEPISDENAPHTSRRRDPRFRERILMAYEYRCCVCGHDLRLKHELIALEAAHIKWFQAGGPDVEQNGLALCSPHHKVFDLGAFTVLPKSYVMVFSQHLNGAAHNLLSYHGACIQYPQSKSYCCGRTNIDHLCRLNIDQGLLLT